MITTETSNNTKETNNNNMLIVGRNAVQEYYTLKEAAIVLCRSTKSVRRLIDRGELPKDAKFGRVLIPRKALEVYVKKSAEFSFSA